LFSLFIDAKVKLFRESTKFFTKKRLPDAKSGKKIQFFEKK